MPRWYWIVGLYFVGAWPTYGYLYTTLDDGNKSLALMGTYVWPLYWFGQTSVWFFEAMG